MKILQRRKDTSENNSLGLETLSGLVVVGGWRVGFEFFGLVCFGIFGYMAFMPRINPRNRNFAVNRCKCMTRSESWRVGELTKHE